MHGKSVPAYTFVADPAHPNYAGRLPIDEAADLILRAEGISGLNRDYLINTVGELEAQGFSDPALSQLLERVKTLTGQIDMGGGI